MIFHINLRVEPFRFNTGYLFFNFEITTWATDIRVNVAVQDYSLEYMYVYIYIYVCVCVCVFIKIYIYLHTHTHTHIKFLPYA
jgi:hypothetical protein